MTADVTRELARIERGLAALGRSSGLDLLRPGLTAEQVRAWLSECGLKSAVELEQVYAWRDGTDVKRAGTRDDINLLPGFYLLSLEDAVANYQAFVGDRRWTHGWLPVLANGGGDFYVADLNSNSSVVVRHFRIDEPEHPVEFESILAMLLTMSECLERGVFYIDPDGYLEMDDLQFASVAKIFNPHVSWWRT